MRTLIVLFILSMLGLQACTTSLTKGADRRTQGAYIEDETIEDTANTRIKNKYKEKVHINVNSYNRKVLVTGEVTDEAVKTDITRIIGGVQNVTAINNELTIGARTPLSSRSSDGLTTSNVKLRLNDRAKDLNSDLIKVVTENGTVYLLGLITRAEGAVASDIASTSKGVKKVVPLFDYID
jgi:osmotically-inducible protein OsmY